MLNRFSRAELIFGAEALKKLSKCRVAVFGIGGVGGYVVEALARGGVGKLVLVDSDEVCLTNLNRQIIATEATIGKSKVECAKERVLSINPACTVEVYPVFFLPENANEFDFTSYDYVVDAVDTVAAKIALIEASKKAGTPIICAMGAGNKVDPTAFTVADIEKTSVDPLARVIRTECRKRGIRNVKTVYSKESPIKNHKAEVSEQTMKRSLPGSTSFVPPVMGLIMAGEVIKDLIGYRQDLIVE